MKIHYMNLKFVLSFLFISSILEISESKRTRSNGEYSALSNAASRIKKRSISSSGLFSSDENGEEDEKNALNSAKEKSIANDKIKKIKTAGLNFQLPEGYNKLKAPVLTKRMLMQKIVGKELLDEINESNETMSEEDDTLPILLKVYVLLRSIREVDEIEEEITVELDFVASWLDFHLCIENDCLPDLMNAEDGLEIYKNMTSIDPVFLKEIWKPDLFIENVVEISRPELITKPVKLLYNPKGYIVLQTRVTLTMDCEMKFHYYPADTQHCIFKIRSYSHTSKELNMVWNMDGDHDGVFLEDRGESNYDVKVESVNSSEKTEWEGLLGDNYSENYTILEFTISVRRKFSYHLIQTYLPSVFFIIITWLCFLVPSTMVEARIGVSMTTLLTLTSMFSSVRENTPIVSYVKAIDIWMVACIFAVFLTLLEFTVLIWLRHSHKESSSEFITDREGSHLNLQRFPDKRQEGKDEMELDKLEPLNSRDTSSGPMQKTKSVIVGFIPGATHFNNKEKVANWIEKHAFSIFSVLFFIFNIVYWSWLLYTSGYFDWSIDPLFNSPDDY